MSALHRREAAAARKLRKMQQNQETHRAQKEPWADLAQRIGSGKFEFKSSMHIPVNTPSGVSEASVAEVSVRVSQLCRRSWAMYACISH